jgi:hypothetical protein
MAIVLQLGKRKLRGLIHIGKGLILCALCGLIFTNNIKITSFRNTPVK